MRFFKSLTLRQIVSGYISVIVIFLGVACAKTGDEGKIITADELKAAITQLENEPQYFPIIRLGKTTISKVELSDSFKELFSKPEESDDYDRVAKSVLEHVLAQNYLYLEAIKKGIDVDPELKLAWEVKSMLWMGDLFIAREKAKIHLDSEIIEAMIPGDTFAFKIHQISTDDLASTQDLRARLIEGENFEELAKTYSIDPVAPRGGEIRAYQVMGLAGLYSDDLLGRLAAVEVGELSTVLKTPLGYTVFRIDEKRPLNDAEKSAIVQQKDFNLRTELHNKLEESIREKHSITVNEKALKKALESNDEEVVVATVGSLQIQLRWLNGFVDNVLHPLDVPAIRTVEGWLPVTEMFAKGLTLYLEALEQGFDEDEIVKENIERIKKHSLAVSVLMKIKEIPEPTDLEAYKYYMGKIGKMAEDAVFSVVGIAGVEDFNTISRVEKMLSKGAALEEILDAVELPENIETFSGTYSDKDFELDTIINLEMTSANNTTKPFKSGTAWSVFRLDGKRRGDLEPFEQILPKVKRSYQFEASEFEEKAIVIRWSKKLTPEYIVPRDVITGLIGRWLDLQKALKGVSPPGGFHKGGSRSVPSGHP